MHILLDAHQLYTTEDFSCCREVGLASGFTSGNENVERSVDIEGASCLLTS